MMSEEATETCQTCGGECTIECPRCCGDGETCRDSWNYGHEFHDTIVRTCDKCDGEGVIECEECEGEGRVEL